VISSRASLKSFMSQMRNEAMSVKPEEKERILSALKTLAAFVETMEVSQSCQSCLH
jgi:hypothetical protein